MSGNTVAGGGVVAESVDSPPGGVVLDENVVAEPAQGTGGVVVAEGVVAEPA